MAFQASRLCYRIFIHPLTKHLITTPTSAKCPLFLSIISLDYTQGRIGCHPRSRGISEIPLILIIQGFLNCLEYIWSPHYLRETDNPSDYGRIYPIRYYDPQIDEWN